MKYIKSRAIFERLGNIEGRKMIDLVYNFKNGSVHYGKYGVLFKSSGVKLFHNGDEELQTIFIGDQVSNMIPFYYDEDTRELYNKDNSIRTKEFAEFFEQIIN